MLAWITPSFKTDPRYIPAPQGSPTPFGVTDLRVYILAKVGEPCTTARVCRAWHRATKEVLAFLFEQYCDAFPELEFYARFFQYEERSQRAVLIIREILFETKICTKNFKLPKKSNPFDLKVLLPLAHNLELLKKENYESLICIVETYPQKGSFQVKSTSLRTKFLVENSALVERELQERGVPIEQINVIRTYTITHLPKEISLFVNLRRMEIADDKLLSFPPEIVQLKQLRHIVFEKPLKWDSTVTERICYGAYRNIVETCKKMPALRRVSLNQQDTLLHIFFKEFAPEVSVEIYDDKKVSPMDIQLMSDQ